MTSYVCNKCGWAGPVTAGGWHQGCNYAAVAVRPTEPSDLTFGIDIIGGLRSDLAASRAECERLRAEVGTLSQRWHDATQEWSVERRDWAARNARLKTSLAISHTRDEAGRAVVCRLSSLCYLADEAGATPEIDKNKIKSALSEYDRATMGGPGRIVAIHVDPVAALCDLDKEVQGG